MAADSRGIRIAGLTLGGSVVAIVTVVTAMALTGVVGPAATLPTAAADELPPFAGCNELAAWYRDAALPLVTAWGLPGAGGPVMFASGVASSAGAADGARSAVAPGPAPAPAAAGGEAVGNGATGTNLQEAGVDEPDVVKTDGRFVVGIADQRLYVADTTGTPRVVGTVTLPAGGGELLLDGDRALVFSGGSPIGIEEPMIRGGLRPQQWTQTTVLTVVDLSDRTHPRITTTEEVDGDYLSARLHDGVVRVVVATGPSPARLKLTTPTFASTPNEAPPSPSRIRDAELVALAENRAAVRRAGAQDWLPQRTVRDENGTVTARGPLLDCTDVRHPTQQSGLRTLSVLTLDLSAPRPFATARPTAVTADGDLVYASTDHLYVATSRWGSWSTATPDDRPTTQIHEFDISSPDATSYVASGSVDGFVYGRWAFSEQDGRLRVATTSGTPWRGMEGATPATESRVVVLERSGATLRAVGQVGGLGPGELVRAVRWFGDLAAVVTFRQTDPLYLLDLSSPTSPRLRGELQMPGYSAYLHPAGDGRLLGIGHDADQNGRLQELQVALFDVSDPSHPARTSVAHLGSGWTQVENESRAFTYLPSRHLALLPVTWYPQVKPEQASIASDSAVAAPVPSTPAAGVAAVSVDGAQLHEAGRWTLGGRGWSDVQRILPVGERLVAVTQLSLELLDPDGLRPVASVSLR